MFGHTTSSFLFALLMVSLSYEGVAAGLIDGLLGGVLNLVNSLLEVTLGISLGGGALININLNAGLLSNSACTAQNEVIGISIALLGLLRVCACVALGTGDYNSAGTAVYQTGLFGIKTQTATQHSCGTCPTNAQPVCVTASGGGLNAAGGCACGCNTGYYADATLGTCILISTCASPYGSLTYSTNSNALATCTCTAPYSRTATTGLCSTCASGYTQQTDGTCKKLTTSARARLKRRLADQAVDVTDAHAAPAAPAAPANVHVRAHRAAQPHHQNAARAARVGAGQVHRAGAGADADADDEQVSFNSDSTLLKYNARSACPDDETACPLRSGAFECVDTTSDLASCGGCVGLKGTGAGENCLAIPGALQVECFQSKCHVASCFKGWVFDGHRCKKQRSRG